MKSIKPRILFFLILLFLTLLLILIASSFFNSRNYSLTNELAHIDSNFTDNTVNAVQGNCNYIYLANAMCGFYIY